jgi:hypothetical protein
LGSIGLPTQHRSVRLINPTDYKCEINRFYRLIDRPLVDRSCRLDAHEQ